MNAQERQQRYLQKVIENQLEIVRSAIQGERNGVLFKSAATLAEFIAAGVFSEEDIRNLLYEAGISCGLDRSEVRATIRSGFKAGYRNPRKLNFEEEWSKINLDIPVSPPSPPMYPPTKEIVRLWESCLRLVSLDSSDPVLSYLTDRVLDPNLLSRLDLVRILPTQQKLPDWCPNLQYRLVIPMYDAIGSLRSLRFRASGDPGVGVDGQKRPKASPPRGFEQRGLVMVDGMAKALLSGSQRHGEASWDGRVVICEGEPDWWSWASRAYEGEAQKNRYAVFGIVSGSWSSEVASRIPDGATIIVRTDQNPAGDRYAEVIYNSLFRRCTIKRPKPAAYGIRL